MEIDKRAIVGIAIAGVTCILASKIPLPGVDLEAAMQNQSLGIRLSLMALGLTPLFTALAYAEIARLVLMHLPQPGGSYLGRLVTFSLALGIAALQSYGVATALSSANLLSGNFAEIAIVATCVGTTAIAIFISEILRLGGLQNGFWMLWIAAYLIKVPDDLGRAISVTAEGSASLSEWTIILAYTAASIYAACIIRSLWISAYYDGVPLCLRKDGMEIIVWPPYLASICSGYILMGLAFVAPETINALMPYGKILVFGTMCLLLPLFTYGYFRRAQRQTSAPIPRQVFVLISTVQILIVASGAIIDANRTLPIWISGLSTITLTVVLLNVAFPKRVGSSRYVGVDEGRAAQPH